MFSTITRLVLQAKLANPSTQGEQQRVVLTDKAKEKKKCKACSWAEGDKRLEFTRTYFFTCIFVIFFFVFIFENYKNGGTSREIIVLCILKSSWVLKMPPGSVRFKNGIRYIRNTWTIGSAGVKCPIFKTTFTMNA